MTTDDEVNWVAKEVGHLLEDLVARIFARKTGLKIFQRKVMYQHPHYPWMLADLDYLAEQPDGTLAIVEIKTTNYNARDKWVYNDLEIVPPYYEAQGRHYMAVVNLNRVYYLGPSFKDAPPVAITPHQFANGDICLPVC